MKTKLLTQPVSRPRVPKDSAPTRENPPRDAKQVRVPSPAPDAYAAITDPTKVDHPIMELVNPALSRGYRINKNLPMAFIFDRVRPTRVFKRGMAYDPAGSFPQWTPEELDDATDTDEVDEKGEGSLMPFDAKPYS